MNDKKYPIGTKIIYRGCCNNCKDKIGEIVSVNRDFCHIKIPTSTCLSRDRGYAKWGEIEPLIAKGQQLLFSFMSEAT